MQTRLIPLEIAVHLLAAGLLGAGLWSSIDHRYLQLFIVAVGVTIGLRTLLLVLSARAAASDAGQRNPGPRTLLATAAAGTLWGLATALAAWQFTVPASAGNLFPIAIGATAMITYATSSLHAPTLLSFALPALLPSLGWTLWQKNIEQVVTWGLLLLVVVALAYASRRVETLLGRFQQRSRGNTELMKNLAVARDAAVANQKQAEQAAEALKTEIKERQRAEEQIRSSEQELGRILDDMADLYFRVDKDGKLVRVSPSIEFLLGCSVDDSLDKPWLELFAHPEDHTAFQDTLQGGFGMVHGFEARFRHMSGEDTWVSINAHHHHDPQGNLDGFEGIARDTAERRQASEALFQEKELLRVTLQSIADGVITTHPDGTVRYINAVAQATTGWSAVEAEGKRLTDILTLVNEDSREPIDLPTEQWLKRGEPAALPEPAMLLSRDKSREWAIELSGAPIRDSENTVIGSVMVFHDVTKLRSLTKQLSYEATHDGLTSLINRAEFDNRVEQAIHSANRGEKTHAVFYIDLDQFKVVNDTCGHHAGDQLLQQVTRTLRNSMRQSDTLARLGGDEFGVLLTGCGLEKAAEIAETFRKIVEDIRFGWEGKIFRIGASIGVVPITAEETSLTKLLSSADAACYVAKEQGRNRVYVFRPEDTALAEHHGQMQWIQRIQRAIEQDLFTLYLQPICSIAETKEATQHGELLLRMITETEGGEVLILPGAFIPAAERYHLMPQIDRWVIRKALKTLSEREFDGAHTFTLNLSGQSLSDITLFDYIKGLLDDTGVAPTSICFEITESAVISHIDVAQEFIRRLKDLGCSFALDDFGSGLSSFEYLKNLPVDYLKLDGSLVKDVTTHRVSQAMIHAINYVAHVMGMKSIAEYVENEETIDALRKMSVDYGQGYAMGKPERFV